MVQSSDPVVEKNLTYYHNQNSLPANTDFEGDSTVIPSNLNTMAINTVHGPSIQSLDGDDHSSKIHATSVHVSPCRGSSSDTIANKINPYYLIG